MIVKATFGCGIVFYRIMQQILAFVHGRHAEALEAAARAEPMLGAAMAMPIEATYHFYHALTLTALYPAASLRNRQNIAASLRINWRSSNFGPRTARRIIVIA